MARIVRHATTKEILFVATEDDTGTWAASVAAEEQEERIVEGIDQQEAMREIHAAALAKLPVDSDPRTHAADEVLIKAQRYTDEDGFDADPVPLEIAVEPPVGTALVKKKFEEFAARTGKDPSAPVTLAEIGEVMGEAAREEFGDGA